MNKKFQTKHISDTQVCLATDMFRKLLEKQTSTYDVYYSFGSKKYAETHDERFINDFLNEITGAPLKVCFNAMERAERNGFIECGVSLRTSWLTEKGEELIKEEALKDSFYKTMDSLMESHCGKELCEIEHPHSEGGISEE